MRDSWRKGLIPKPPPGTFLPELAGGVVDWGLHEDNAEAERILSNIHENRTKFMASHARKPEWRFPKRHPAGGRSHGRLCQRYPQGKASLP